MYKAIVFDFDGVITDGIPLHDKAYLDLFKKYNINISIDQLHTKIGLTTKEVISEIFEEFDVQENIDNIVEKHSQILYKLYQEKAKQPANLVEFLKSCKNNNLQIALASSTHSKILKMVLEKFDIADYFESIVGGETVSKGKPDPEMISKALKKINIDPSEAIAIDDAHSGIIAAKKINMYAIAYTKYSQAKIDEADISVEDFNEINISKIVKKGSLAS